MAFEPIATRSPMTTRTGPRPAKEVAQAIDLARRIDDAVALLRSSPLRRRPFADRLDALRVRLTAEHLQLAILGQFKRGKSTFINALLGAPVLPMGVLPLTAVAIFISWGKDPAVRVRFRTTRPPENFRSADPDALREFLSRYVAEERNPKNALDVERVELSFPSPILSDGTILIDTPGVGSSHRHNTDTALQILSECDAAIVILSPDPPITEIELAYLRKVRAKTAHVIFVLNKADYIGADEQKAVLDFLARVLADNALLEPAAPIFVVSARDALAAKQSANPEPGDRSGIARIEDHIKNTVASEKSRILDQAIRRRAADILSDAVSESELRLVTVTLPLDELATKAREFEKALEAIDEQRRTLHDLLEGDRRRLAGLLETRIRELRDDVSLRLAEVAGEALCDADPTAWEPKAKDLVSVALERLFEAARDRFRKEFTEETAKALALHQNRFQHLVRSVRQTAAELFALPFFPQQEPQSFELGEDPYWVTQDIHTTLIPDPSHVLDHLVPLKRRRARVYSRMMQRVNEMVIRNAENLRWAILRGISDTIVRAEARLDESLKEAVAATKGVIEDVLARRRDRLLESQAELSALGGLANELRMIREAVMPKDTPMPAA